MIPSDKYESIMRVLPILCVDIIVKTESGKYILIKRKNRPLSGRWWVIGGRVLKDEPLEQAAKRKVKEETDLDIKEIRPIGYYEDTFVANPFGTRFRQHSVSLVFLAIVKENQDVKLDYQSLAWKYSKVLPRRFQVKPFGCLQP
ncbi:MAG TPA: NUDIX domain-containing protein [Caldisericia bacterium]|nr:NUDIX domain-containing protein [Caldisericia bacterium]